MTRVVLEIVEGSHPLTGQLLAGQQPPAPFAGYLELIEVLEASRHQHVEIEARRVPDPDRREGRDGA